MSENGDKTRDEAGTPVEGPSADRLGDALLNGGFAHTFSGAAPPRYYDANERWAWDLGWRLQQHLQEEAAKCGK